MGYVTACAKWMPSGWSEKGGFQLIFSELARSDGAETEEALMITPPVGKRIARRPASEKGR